MQRRHLAPRLHQTDPEAGRRFHHRNLLGRARPARAGSASQNRVSRRRRFGDERNADAAPLSRARRPAARMGPTDRRRDGRSAAQGYDGGLRSRTGPAA